MTLQTLKTELALLSFIPHMREILTQLKNVPKEKREEFLQAMQTLNAEGKTNAELEATAMQELQDMLYAAERSVSQLAHRHEEENDMPSFEDFASNHGV